MFHLFECWLLTIECFVNISSSTLYGVTKPVTEVTKLVTHEESLTLLPEGECMRRVVLKSPVLENCTPGSVRGALGNQRPYLANMKRKPFCRCNVAIEAQPLG